ncbi:MAG: hypothetical protein CMJ72_11955 [Planctomycetaceae bacterium]|jgi:hypothetical protein|nr:hypothetical protein [Planctomycetaceae bacterium]HCK42324.1 hypothetical protein [Planctomycetaceae bacterium]
MEIVEYLVEELGVSTRQAQGGAGLLLEFTQQRLDSEDFIRVANCLPAISDIIGKAPKIQYRPPRPLREKFSSLFGGLGGLAGLAETFERLGCDKVMIRKFVDAIIRFFRMKGGEEISSMLIHVLK